MTKEQAIEELKEWQKYNDEEVGHARADDVLCDLLSSLGYDDVVDEWKKIDKWYA